MIDVRIAAAPTQVSSSGTCPDCGYQGSLVGIMYGDRKLRCGSCHDDYFYNVYAPSPPEVRAEAERKRNEILRWMGGG